MDLQANPGKYDIRSAVKQLAVDRWTVNRHAADIHAGDRVYFWESGPASGIVGVGEIAKSNLLRDPFEFNQFVKDPDAFEQSGVAVNVRIAAHTEPMVTKDEVKAVPELGELSIIRQAMGTNFPVSSSQDEALWELVEPRLHQQEWIREQER